MCSDVKLAYLSLDAMWSLILILMTLHLVSICVFLGILSVSHLFERIVEQGKLSVIRVEATYPDCELSASVKNQNLQ